LDLDRLEPSLERRVLLEVLTVLVERGGADRLELTAGEHRLGDGPGVGCPRRRSCGWVMLAAPSAPSAAPAPTSVCSSSMNRMMSPRVLISFSTFLRRSSQSPR